MSNEGGGGRRGKEGDWRRRRKEGEGGERREKGGGGARRGKEGEGGRREEKGEGGARRRSEEGESLEYTRLLLCLPLVESDGEGEERCEHRNQVTPIQQVTKKPATRNYNWYTSKLVLMKM